MVESGDYVGREQAYVKHFVLEGYLERLAYKVGQFQAGTSLNYIDGFSGPWQHSTEELRDTSPHIALTQLRAVKAELEKRSIDLTVRGLFVERDAAAFARLRELLNVFPDIETVALHGLFERHIPAITDFAARGPRPFAFVFIDPTGWTGYGLKAIAPLLATKPSEVLINFMTKDIKRFIDDPESSAIATFVDLFGDEGYRDAWRGLHGLDREDAMVAAYCERIRNAGQFKYVCSTVILNPGKDRTHYHLVYATRSRAGLTTFRETEQQALAQQRAVRAAAKQSFRLAQSPQEELFDARTMDSNYAAGLQDRYHGIARELVLASVQARATIAYEELLDIALQAPMTSERDVKAWLSTWRQQGRMVLEGLAPRARAPRVGSGHKVRWSG